MDYRFVSEERFSQMVARQELLERAEVYGHRYGTPRGFVEERLGRGTDVLLVLDAEGKRQLARSHQAHLVSVFLLPPSLAELRRRLEARGASSAATTSRRLASVQGEIACAKEYDYVLENQDVERTLMKLETLLHVERLRRARQTFPA